MTVYTMDELAAASGLSTERLQKIDDDEIEALAEAVLLDDTPDVVDLSVTDDTPRVTIQVASDDINAMPDARGDVAALLGGCATVLQSLEYAVDKVTIVALPNDRETHEGGLRWRLEASLVQELVEGDLSTPAFLEAVDETNGIIEFDEPAESGVGRGFNNTTR